MLKNTTLYIQSKITGYTQKQENVTHNQANSPSVTGTAGGRLRAETLKLRPPQAMLSVLKVLKKHKNNTRKMDSTTRTRMSFHNI